MSFYNTTQELPEQVQIFTDKNNTQDEVVLKIINKLKRNFSASQVWKRYPIANVPLTSIRRSINTLNTKLGLIEKLTDENGKNITTKGFYGRPECLYRKVEQELKSA